MAQAKKKALRATAGGPLRTVAVDLPQDLVRRLNVYCAERGLKKRAVVEEAIRKILGT